ncbi:hypothetical protein PR048_019655 [Dryococelus australis]|uniref:Uncharacterized protein n=1 Tax=Dryococelus australis TaxID=614101 RepID=A0ABQ9H416_9NEOP|nr:hypothetical protein PR048_019655 [Dryococelus australis]
MVHKIQETLTEYIKENIPNIIEIHYYSDGCAAQYQNNHRKTECDGIGATVKRLARKETLQRSRQNPILTPDEFFQFCKFNIRKVNFHFISKDSVNLIRSKPKNTSGTRSFHNFRPLYCSGTLEASDEKSSLAYSLKTKMRGGCPEGTMYTACYSGVQRIDSGIEDAGVGMSSASQHDSRERCRFSLYIENCSFMAVTGMRGLLASYRRDWVSDPQEFDQAGALKILVRPYSSWELNQVPRLSAALRGYRIAKGPQLRIGDALMVRTLAEQISGPYRLGVRAATYPFLRSRPYASWRADELCPEPWKGTSLYTEHLSLVAFERVQEWLFLIACGGGIDSSIASALGSGGCDVSQAEVLLSCRDSWNLVIIGQTVDGSSNTARHPNRESSQGLLASRADRHVANLGHPKETVDEPLMPDTHVMQSPMPIKPSITGCP